MAVFREEHETKGASLGFKIYSDEVEVLSVAIKTPECMVILKLDREDCIGVATKLLKAAQVIKG